MSHDESLLHAIHDCGFGKSIWFNLLNGMRMPFHFFHVDSFKKWLVSNLKRGNFHSSGEGWGRIFGVTYWVVWKQKNMPFFKGKARLIEGTIGLILNSVKNFSSAISKVPLGEVKKRARIIKWNRWSPPLLSWFKLNSNGAVSSNSGLALSGGIIWNAKGVWVSWFVANFGRSSTERFAVTPREANFAVDYIAHLGAAVSLGVHVISEIPEELRSWLLHDLIGPKSIDVSKRQESGFINGETNRNDEKNGENDNEGENRGDRSMKIKRFGEVAGGTAAECTAVCCCCPCTVMNILVLAIYKMPACICRRARERHRVMKRQQQTLLVHAGRNDLCREELEREVQAVAEKQKPCGGGDDDDGKTEAVDLEKDVGPFLCNWVLEKPLSKKYMMMMMGFFFWVSFDLNFLQGRLRED
ncbi:hypothetical protein GH714_014752 [Hevea brasiliensis]|uniref:Uncharacterized protein n=1 Tax=Hevea brasiliensis TaxID=3981 RepID=A0A6A6NCX2_HEVBR|nr:hypothetical protein GH714_014752 [Hevea brasiliensis]